MVVADVRQRREAGRQRADPDDEGPAVADGGRQLVVQGGLRVCTVISVRVAVVVLSATTTAVLPFASMPRRRSSAASRRDAQAGEGQDEGGRGGRA